MLLFPCFLPYPNLSVNISPQIKSLLKHATFGREDQCGHFYQES